MDRSAPLVGRTPFGVKRLITFGSRRMSADVTAARVSPLEARSHAHFPGYSPNPPPDSPSDGRVSDNLLRFAVRLASRLFSNSEGMGN
jgi:hypothetical protein